MAHILIAWAMPTRRCAKLPAWPRPKGDALSDPSTRSLGDHCVDYRNDGWLIILGQALERLEAAELTGLGDRDPMPLPVQRGPVLVRGEVG